MNGFDSLSDGAQKFLKIATAVTLLASVVGYIVRFETERERVLEHFQSEVMFHDSIRRHRIGADSIHRYLLCREAAIDAQAEDGELTPLPNYCALQIDGSRWEAEFQRFRARLGRQP